MSQFQCSLTNTEDMTFTCKFFHKNYTPMPQEEREQFTEKEIQEKELDYTFVCKKPQVPGVYLSCMYCIEISDNGQTVLKVPKSFENIEGYL